MIRWSFHVHKLDVSSLLCLHPLCVECDARSSFLFVKDLPYPAGLTSRTTAHSFRTQETSRKIRFFPVPAVLSIWINQLELADTAFALHVRSHTALEHSTYHAYCTVERVL